MADGLINLNTVEPLAYQLWLETLPPEKKNKRHKLWVNLGQRTREAWRMKARAALEKQRANPPPTALSRMTYWHERHMIAFDEGTMLHRFHSEEAEKLRRFKTEGIDA